MYANTTKTQNLFLFLTKWTSERNLGEDKMINLQYKKKKNSKMNKKENRS